MKLRVVLGSVFALSLVMAAGMAFGADGENALATTPVVPEPAGIIAMATGLVGLAGFLRRK